MDRVVLLGSQSSSRQELLRQAEIPFRLVQQDSDEACCDWNRPFNEIVASIAQSKMDHVILHEGVEGEYCFVLTADTMTLSSEGEIFGKPVDRDDAIKKIKSARDGAVTGTALCLDKKIWSQGAWHTYKRIEQFARGTCSFDVPDEWLDIYLSRPFVYKCAGALFVDGYGAQFVRDVQGSYTAIMGMPMFELREALTSLGFFDI
ncbi:MAG TPA: Maf family protein [Candidatus Dependentiae bacterium]|nr:Maf family protein [Candidatus Dependentiae bacterium]